MKKRGEERGEEMEKEEKIKGEKEELEEIREILKEIKEYIDRMSYCEVIDNPREDIKKILTRGREK